MRHFAKRYFQSAIKENIKLSMALTRLLETIDEEMPADLCRLLDLPEGSTFADGVFKYTGHRKEIKEVVEI